MNFQANNGLIIDCGRVCYRHSDTSEMRSQIIADPGPTCNNGLAPPRHGAV